MSAFKENDEYEPTKFERTDFGFALAQEAMPHRRDVFWLKLPERHVYSFDGDGWIRLNPPEKRIFPRTELPHG
jgi:hypothetical protein